MTTTPMDVRLDAIDFLNAVNAAATPPPRVYGDIGDVCGLCGYTARTSSCVVNGVCKREWECRARRGLDPADEFSIAFDVDEDELAEEYGYRASAQERWLDEIAEDLLFEEGFPTGNNELVEVA